MNEIYEIKNMKYEMVYSPEVVEEIKEWVSIDHSAEDCLDFVDRYGEEAFLEHYEAYVDFDQDYPTIDLDILFDYYSGFDYLYLSFYGEYSSIQAFIEHYYIELDALPPIIMIDWEQTISQVEKLFDFIPTKKNTIYVLAP